MTVFRDLLFRCVISGEPLLTFRCITPDIKNRQQKKKNEKKVTDFEWAYLLWKIRIMEILQFVEFLALVVF